MSKTPAEPSTGEREAFTDGDKERIGNAFERFGDLIGRGREPAEAFILAVLRVVNETRAALAAQAPSPVSPNEPMAEPDKRLAHALQHAKVAVQFIVDGAKARPDLMCGYWDDACTHAEIAVKDLEAIVAAPIQPRQAPSDALTDSDRLADVLKYGVPYSKDMTYTAEQVIGFIDERIISTQGDRNG